MDLFFVQVLTCGNGATLTGLQAGEGHGDKGPCEDMGRVGRSLEEGPGIIHTKAAELSRRGDSSAHHKGKKPTGRECEGQSRGGKGQTRFGTRRGKMEHDLSREGKAVWPSGVEDFKRRSHEGDVGQTVRILASPLQFRAGVSKLSASLGHMGRRGIVLSHP